MDVEFRRTGEKRYAVVIRRPDDTVLEMNPAPGYDPLMPHDLVHFVVERELGLQLGIFGQIAKGGGGFTLHAPNKAGQRAEARLRRRKSKRHARLVREGRNDLATSESAVYMYRQLWEAQRDSALLHSKTESRICALLDELSQKWMRLRVGEALTVTWPEAFQ
jgi:hypothetical protein